MNHLNLTFIFLTSKITIKHFKIKNEIDPQCFLPHVCAKTPCSMLTFLEKKETRHSLSTDCNVGAYWVLVYYKFTIDVTY